MKKENAVNFLLFSYFGIILENSKDDIISAAINRAYRDAASHVLSLKDDSKKDTEKGKKLFADACDCIEKFINDVLTNGTQNKLNENENEYDEKHQDLSKKLKEMYSKCTNSGYEFSYGIAQKWVNMTMKYLGVILTIFSEYNNTHDFVNTYKNSFQAIEHYLHVPIDGYILEYVSNKKYSNVEAIDIDKKENNNNLAWSKYEEENYKTLQNNIKNKFIKEKTSPLDWENKAWIEVAKSKKRVQ